VPDGGLVLFPAARVAVGVFVHFDVDPFAAGRGHGDGQQVR